MKRKNERVPEFDEIIFASRNQTYGAYNLRKRYNSTTSFSILGAVSIFVILVIALSLNSNTGTASAANDPIIVVLVDQAKPEFVKPVETKPPVEMMNAIKNLKPVVTDDTSKVTLDLPTNDELIDKVTNGNVNDTIIAVENPQPEISEEVETIPVSVQEMPEFPGGMSALMKYVGDHLNYPAEAQRNNIEGKVFLKFVVNTDGSVNRIELIRGIDPVLDNEAIRVIGTLPRFKPGRQNGVAVRVWFSMPINFKIENN